jgi:hypothetical protein
MVASPCHGNDAKGATTEAIETHGHPRRDHRRRPPSETGATSAVQDTRRETMTTTDLTAQVLTDEMLGRFDERAPVYDRENRFFT